MWRENPKLYEVAKRLCHSFDLPWTDPRTGKIYLPPTKKAKKADVRKKEKGLGKS